MNSSWGSTQNSTSNKPANTRIQNFLESLKNSSGSDSISRGESPFGRNPFAEMNRQKELEKMRVQQFHQAREKEWEQVYSAKDKQIQRQIEEIRLQLKDLAKQIVKYDQNITVAIQNQVVNPGAYHLSFFEHLREVIMLIKKNVSEANSWLSLYNKRAKQKGAFMGNVKKGGTAYMMSGEHSITRSVG